MYQTDSRIMFQCMYNMTRSIGTTAFLIMQLLCFSSREDACDCFAGEVQGGGS